MDTKLIWYKKYNYRPESYVAQNEIFSNFLNTNETMIKNSDLHPSSFYEWRKKVDINRESKRNFYEGF